MKIGCFFLAIFLCSLASAWAQEEVSNYYWIGFNDKKGTLFSTDHPEDFLSARSVQRRLKQGIPIDELDLPISPDYLDSLTTAGAKIIHTSKWLNGVTILATEQQYQSIISTFSFIRESELTKPGLMDKALRNKFSNEKIHSEIDSSYYGYSVYQVGQLNGHFLHENDFQGQGMQIAVLDAGFYKANEFPALETLYQENRILGTRDFVDPQSNIYTTHSHGMSVLSTMGGNLPGYLIGTAPKASYYLIRSEDAQSEYLIEEDNWVAAAEYADSLGVDVINSSLGYYEFDDSNMNHTYQDMDGETNRVTRAANIAFQKGILVVASAGNEANDPWHYIISPADGDQVLAIGAVNESGVWASFSSVGPSSDNDVKPNVAAMGLNSVIQNFDGNLAVANGTSFSSPILAGMATCLWQAFPTASNQQIKTAIEESASQFANPDTLLGYGIPNFEYAYSILENSQQNQQTEKHWKLAPNPFASEIHFIKQDHFQPLEGVQVSLTGSNGQLFFRHFFAPADPLYLGNLSNLPAGMYIVFIQTNGETEYHKLIKMPE